MRPPFWRQAAALVGLMCIAVLPARSQDGSTDSGASSSSPPAQPATLVNPKPLWEVGAGVGSWIFDDYRGSATMHALPVPVPYLVYRGAILRSDQDGFHSRFLNRSYLTLDVSLDATAPVFTRTDGPRAGMPSLDPTVEIGPELQLHLWRSQDQHVRFDLRAAARYALTVSTAPRSVGWDLDPRLNLDYTGPVTRGFSLGVQAGPLFAQRHYDEYFYRVAPEYETASRPAYDPPGGYSGVQLALAVSKRYPKYWVGAYIRHDSLGGASFGHSPLVQQDGYWATGVGFVWILKASTKMVDSDD